MSQRKWLVFFVALCALLACAACARSHTSTCDQTRACIGGEWFTLDALRDEQSQHIGLAGREPLTSHEGVLFIFDAPQPMVFVMRDVHVPIDVAFVDDDGQVVALHAMLPEAPRTVKESSADPHTDFMYESRLTQYVCDLPVRYAIEVRGGTWHRLGLMEGSLIKFAGNASVSSSR